MNTIEKLGDEETFRNIVERTITEFEDSEIEVIGDYAFRSCSALTSVSFPNATTIGSSAFRSCSALTTLYIGTESDTVCTLSSTNAIPSNVTDIYVPVELVGSYKTATNWSSFADKIQSYEVPVSCQSLTITAEDVPGYKTSTIVHYEAVCTYSIEGMMQTGTKVFKDDAVSDTFGINPSGESSRQVEVSYTLLGKTATTTITQDKYLGNPVGGKIFYIDDTAAGEYEFYDTDGNVISDVKVGDKPAMYKVLTPGTKDKYYVCDTTLYPNSRWTYSKNGRYVYNNLGTGTAIGTGKTNTDTVMAADNGAYITPDSNGYSTIWYQLSQARSLSLGGNTDWFIPSREEMDKVRTSGIISFSGKFIWSSSESSSDRVLGWYSSYWGNNYKGDDYPVFFVRAF